MKTNENEILLSFILPVYNVEEYLKECVDSIRTQITDECEIILVDDGSPDNCPYICDEYAKSDKRVKVVHKENGGLSSARNAGIEVARGRYVTYVDSDDLITPNSIPKLIEWIKSENADICFLQVEKLYPDGTRRDLGEYIYGESLRGHSRKEAITYLAYRPKYPGSAWGKLFRREFLIDNNLHFPYDRRYSEDLGYIRDCIIYAAEFDALDIPFYQYRQNRQGSITNMVSTKNFYDLLQFIVESSEKLTSNKQSQDHISRLIMGFAAYEYSILLFLYSLIPKADRKGAWIKLKEYKWTLKYACSTKIKVIYIVCSILGVKLTSLLMGKYRKATEK